MAHQGGLIVGGCFGARDALQWRSSIRVVGLRLGGAGKVGVPVLDEAWRVRGRRQGTARSAVGEVLVVDVPVFGCLSSV